MRETADKSDPTDPFAELLKRSQAGDSAARNQLYELIYAELKRIAVVLMKAQPAGHTLQASDLVGAAYQKIEVPSCKDRGHFFALAATAMRQVLVDHARGKHSRRRTPLGERVPLEDIAAAFEASSGGILKLDAALARLGKLDPLYVRIIELHYFAGLPQEEAAKLLDVPLRNFQRALRFAKAWLKVELGREQG